MIPQFPFNYPSKSRGLRYRVVAAVVLVIFLLVVVVAVVFSIVRVLG